MFEVIHNLLDNTDFQANVKFKNTFYSAQQKIVKQGTQHNKVFLIKNGNIRVIVNADQSESINLHPGIAELKSNDIFGEFGLFDDLPASADVIAATDSELIEIEIDSFREYLKTHPEIAYEILHDMLKIMVKR